MDWTHGAHGAETAWWKGRIVTDAHALEENA
jgi:hypothetical protein